MNRSEQSAQLRTRASSGPVTLVTIALVSWGQMGWFALALVLAAGALANRRFGIRELARRLSS